MESGTIDVIKVEETSERFRALRPHEYDRAKALRHYLESTLTRTALAEREISLLLDPPIPGRRFIAPEMTDPPEGESSASTVDSAGGRGYTIAHLAAEIGIDAVVARKILRRRMSKPGGRWEWSTPAEAREARDILLQTVTN